MSRAITKGMGKSRRRGPRLPTARRPPEILPPRPSPDPSWFGAAAIRARGLASELSILADRLVAPHTDDETRRELAEETSRMVWSIRGYQRDTAMRIAFVLALQDAIEHVEVWRASVIRARLDLGHALSDVEVQWRSDLRSSAARARIERPYPSREVAESVIAVSEWLYSASPGSEARAWYVAEWPATARRISVEDCELAARAMRERGPMRWRTIAALLASRLGPGVSADTLDQYVRRYRRRFGAAK